MIPSVFASAVWMFNMTVLHRQRPNQATQRTPKAFGVADLVSR